MEREKLSRKMTLQPLTGSDVDIPGRVRPSTPKKIEGTLTRQHRGGETQLPVQQPGS